MKYRIHRDEGRGIGHDVLIYNFKGMSFVPPGEKFIRPGEAIFEADLKTCRIIAEKLGHNCYVAGHKGRRTS